MHHIIGHILSPLLAAVLSGAVFVDLMAAPEVSVAHWLPWTLGLVALSAAWWLIRHREETWIPVVMAGLVAVVFASLWLPVHQWVSEEGRIWSLAWVIAVTAVGAYSLAAYRRACVVWLFCSGVPLVVSSGPQAWFTVLFLGCWTMICLARYRTLRKFARAWEALEIRDPVTGLGRRKSFDAKLSNLLIHRPDQPPLLGILCIDRFKELNHAFGFPFGDHLLQTVADRIVAQLGPADLATRTGGSEIALVLQGGSRKAEELLAALRGSYTVHDTRTQVGISAGWAPPPVGTASSQVWMSHARTALATAWEAGENESRYYDPVEETRRKRRRKWAEDLEKALARDEFFLEFQPQFSTETGLPTGAEALVRWRHPVDGVIPPLEFIPLAEETGLISHLGTWILDQALDQASLWPSNWTVAVNVSARQLTDPTFPGQVWESLARHSFAAHRLTLEITETILINDGPQAKDVLQGFRNRGIRISLDDFGTGYSSLLYLRNYPLDELKVDQAFVRSLEGHRESLAIVETILNLAQTLGIKTTAEGIEKQGQAEILKGFGCGVFQGYYFSRPLRDPRTILTNPGSS